MTTKCERLTLEPGCGEDGVPPNVQHVIVEKLENEGEKCHCCDDPDKFIRVETKVSVFDDLCGKPTSKENDKLDKIQDIKCKLSGER